VSDTRIRPRFELEDGTVARLEAETLPAVMPSRSGPGTLGLVAGGAAVLVVGLAALDAGNFVATQFERAPALGWATLAVAGAGFGLLGAAAWRELRGLFGLRRVDRLRLALADPGQCKAAALTWLDGLPEGAALRAAVAATDDPAAIAALLRAGPLAVLRSRADALGRLAALQVFAAAAAVPSPSLDGLLVAWRGARLVRQVAELHGLRPGLFATLSLLRRVVLTAASVVATDVAADAIARAVLSNPLLERLAGDVAGAGMAARRMVVLARVTAAACSPLGPG
jgi:putative membrane protein